MSELFDFLLRDGGEILKAGDDFIRLPRSKLRE